MKKTSVCVFASGRGSNLQSLISYSRTNAGCDWAVTLVISDNADANALLIAQKEGIESFFVNPAGRTKTEFETEINDILLNRQIEIIALAGYMRLVGKTLLKFWKGKILNIHPSILPSFPGLDAQQKAVESGVLFSGCTVHLVDEGMDTGKILGQSTVKIEATDTPSSLSSRILKKEHVLYGMVLTEYIKFLKNDHALLDLIKNRHDIIMNGNVEMVSELFMSAAISGKPFALISACLCGIECRYDGKSQKLIELERLSEVFELIPVCPESFAGMGIPRKPVEFKYFIEKNVEKCDLRNSDGISFLKVLTEASEKIIRMIEKKDIFFSILKERSPSCGVNWVYVDGNLAPGRGIFSQKLIECGVFVISDESLHENTNSTFNPIMLKLGNKKC